MKKSLLFVNTDMCWGGIEVSLINLLCHMDTNRYDIHLVLLSENLTFLNRLPNSIMIHLLNRNGEELQYAHKELYQYVLKLASIKRNIFQKVLFRVLRKYEARLYVASVRRKLGNYDVAIPYRIGTPLDIVNKKIAPKIITFFHSSYIEYNRHDLHDLLKVDAVVCVSEGQRSQVAKLYPAIESKTRVVHNLSNWRFIKSNCTPTMELSTHKWNLVSCGRLVYDKGFDMLIQAIHILVEMGYDLHLTLIGGKEGSGFSSNVYKIAEEMNMQERVNFLGWTDLPYPIMNSADIYVQSSRYEAYGITIREAQVLGCAILSTDTSGGKELIDDGENGVICEATVEGLCAGLKKLIDNPDLRKKVIAGCMKINFEKEDNNDAVNFCRLLN